MRIQTVKYIRRSPHVWFTSQTEAERHLSSKKTHRKRYHKSILPSTTSPVKIENRVFCADTVFSIDCDKAPVVSHPWLPMGPAETETAPVWSANFLQQIGLVQFASDPGCTECQKENGEKKSTHRVRPVYVHITEVHNSERCFPSRSEDFGHWRGRFREWDGVSVHSRCITEPNQSATELGSCLSRSRNVAQAVGDNGALLLNYSFTDIVILCLIWCISLLRCDEDNTYIERLTDSDECVREDSVPQKSNWFQNTQECMAGATRNGLF